MIRVSRAAMPLPGSGRVWDRWKSGPSIVDPARPGVHNRCFVADKEILNLDGSLGEGGGQVLRSALALSMWLGRPFRIRNIRANRPRPGLRPQHLAAVRAAAEVAAATVEGAAPGATELVFRPCEIRCGSHHVDVGSAGSTTLIAQTLLPALVVAPATSLLRVVGGTHNPMAPTFKFLQQVFLPVLNRMGPVVRARLLRPGYYPAGGGEIELRIAPVPRLRPLTLISRGELIDRRAVARVTGLPSSIARRELKVVSDLLGWSKEERELVRDDTAAGAGNVLSLCLRYRHISEMFTSFGRRGLRAEAVARRAVEACSRYLDTDTPVGSHLADQLLVPLAMSGSGCFRCGRPSSHTLTNMAVIEAFTGARFDCTEITAGDWQVTLARR